MPDNISPFGANPFATMYGQMPGGLAGLGIGMDPSLMMLGPEYQMAQGVTQQGMDTSPTTSPFAGLSRLASAIVGPLMMRNISRQFMTQQGNTQDQMDAAVDKYLAGTPALIGIDVQMRYRAYRPGGECRDEDALLLRAQQLRLGGDLLLQLRDRERHVLGMRRRAPAGRQRDSRGRRTKPVSSHGGSPTKLTSRRN